MARRKWKWPQAVSIELVELETRERHNIVRHASSALVGGLLLGVYGLARANHKHGAKTVYSATFKLTYPDGSTELVTDDADSFIYTHIVRLMRELEEKNETN